MLLNSQVLRFVSRHCIAFLDPVSSVVRVGPLELALVIEVKAELFLDGAKKFRTDTGVGRRDKTLRGRKRPWRMESTPI